jgi:hypothetical protein
VSSPQCLVWLRPAAPTAHRYVNFTKNWAGPLGSEFTSQATTHHRRQFVRVRVAGTCTGLRVQPVLLKKGLFSLFFLNKKVV